MEGKNARRNNSEMAAGKNLYIMTLSIREMVLNPLITLQMTRFTCIYMLSGKKKISVA